MFQEYTVFRIVQESETIKSFYLKPMTGVALQTFLPGQFVNVKLSVEDGKELVRSYSFSDSPGKEYLRLTIKKEERGTVSGYFHKSINVSDEVLISESAGRFYINAETNHALVLISGGLGITPMLSMMEDVVAHQPERSVTFLHSSLNKNLQPMAQRLAEVQMNHANIDVKIFHTEPGSDEVEGKDYDVRGIITPQHIPIIKGEPAHYFVCGPPSFMQTVHSYLQEANIPEAAIHFEFFSPPTKPEPIALVPQPFAEAHKITLTKSSRELFWIDDAGNLLELIEDAGIKPQSSCRMGSCGTCETKLISGSFAYDPEPFVETEEGNLLICCARPTSDITLEL